MLDLGPALSSPWTGIPSSTLSTPPDSPPELVGMSDSPEQQDLGSPSGSITGNTTMGTTSSVTMSMEQFNEPRRASCVSICPPVRWIQTQDLLFTHYNFERLVELGLGPTLIKMATCTLKAKYEAVDESVSRVCQILYHAKNPNGIYYQFKDETTPAPAAPTLAPAVAPVVAAPVAPPGGAVATIPDGPLNADDTLWAIVAQKLKKKVDGVPISKAIKDLVSGESTLQNEILGDLQLKSSSALGKGEALPLDELGAVLSMGYISALGKHTNGLASRMIGGKMPGGFNITAGNT
ncbi:3-oxoacyl-[acyl-carrier-protein] synthase [Ceratobasidium sp. 423]|nr:3-oxoacyl-[acyl-carrier-protein] synthase [Ceratobasidium sp. 423]